MTDKSVYTLSEVAALLSCHSETLRKGHQVRSAPGSQDRQGI